VGQNADSQGMMGRMVMKKKDLLKQTMLEERIDMSVIDRIKVMYEDV
jgi:hypothetical protein